MFLRRGTFGGRDCLFTALHRHLLLRVSFSLNKRAQRESTGGRVDIDRWLREEERERERIRRVAKPEGEGRKQLEVLKVSQPAAVL